jgi:hypothetical protein
MSTVLVLALDVSRIAHCFVLKLGVDTTILNAHWASKLFAMALLIKQYACGYLSFCQILQTVCSHITLPLDGM